MTLITWVIILRLLNLSLSSFYYKIEIKLLPLKFSSVYSAHSSNSDKNDILFQLWIFIGRTDAKAETPIVWLLDSKNWFLGKDPDAGKDWRQDEKGTTEDEMVGWHHRLNRHVKCFNQEKWGKSIWPKALNYEPNNNCKLHLIFLIAFDTFLHCIISASVLLYSSFIPSCLGRKGLANSAFYLLWLKYFTIM